MKLRHALIAAVVLASFAAGLAACSGASQQEIEKANAAVMAKVNAYCDCDGRQMALEALGVGEAGAAP